jgi:hypothetical protein
MHEVADAARRNADRELTEKYQTAVVRAGKAEAEVARLREHLEAIRHAVGDPPPPGGW